MCKSKIALNICGSIFILAAVAFFVYSTTININPMITFSVIIGLGINATLFFILGDMAQKLNIIYKKNN